MGKAPAQVVAKVQAQLASAVADVPITSSCFCRLSTAHGCH